MQVDWQDVQVQKIILIYLPCWQHVSLKARDNKIDKSYSFKTPTLKKADMPCASKLEKYDLKNKDFRYHILFLTIKK